LAAHSKCGLKGVVELLPTQVTVISHITSEQDKYKDYFSLKEVCHSAAANQYTRF